MASTLNKTLIIAPQWIGDAVMTEPMVRYLINLGVEVTVAVLPNIAPVYGAMSGIREILIWPFKRGQLQLIKRLRTAKLIRGRFDRVIICPNSFKNALIPFFADIPQRIGYVGEFRSSLLSKAVANPDKHERGSMVEFYKKLAKEGFAESSQNATSVASVADSPNLSADPIIVDAALLQFKLSPLGYCVLAPGAEYGPAKRWPTEYFVQTAIDLCLAQLQVVVLGSLADKGTADQIEQACEAKGLNVLNLAGKTDLAQAIALVAQARGVISNDSGLMHIAAGLKRPQVAIFGSSSPLHTPPLNELAKVLWLSLPCSPCFKRTCPLGHLNCLKNISVAQVEESFYEVINA